MDIQINYSGWLIIPEEDLKIMKINEKYEFVDVDTTDMTTIEIVGMLNDGKAILKSFNDTLMNSSDHNNDTITFDVEEPF